MSHHGDPEEEVIIVEEPEEPEEPPAKVVKAPRMPTQAEVDAHMAIHLPHEDWCDLCARGRGRNAPHRKKKKRSREVEFENEGTGQGSSSEDASGHGPVSRVCMDYFYVSSRWARRCGRPVHKGDQEETPRLREVQRRGEECPRQEV